MPGNLSFVVKEENLSMRKPDFPHRGLEFPVFSSYNIPA